MLYIYSLVEILQFDIRRSLPFCILVDKSDTQKRLLWTKVSSVQNLSSLDNSVFYSRQNILLFLPRQMSQNCTSIKNAPVDTIIPPPIFGVRIEGYKENENGRERISFFHFSAVRLRLFIWFQSILLMDFRIVLIIELHISVFAGAWCHAESKA